jgi:hypothetical protein
MTIFAIPEATRYCQGYRGSLGAAQGSFRTFGNSLAVGKTFVEGSAAFDELRDWSLREAERQLFLAMATYRRSFSLMTVSMSSWAHVTMYYSAFHSASSLMGMFGCWRLATRKIIDVASSSLNQQELTVRSFSSTYRGSHGSFWDLFYSNMISLTNWVDPKLRIGLLPISQSITWQIDRRNDVNYDSHNAVTAMAEFERTFRKSRVATSLPGPLNTQFQVMENLLRLASKFAREFGLATDALDGLKPKGERREKVRELILDQKLPDLDRSLKRRPLLV